MSARIEMFGCQIDRLRMSEAVGRIYEMIARPSDMCQYVVTPNVQHIVMLQQHDGLRRAMGDTRRRAQEEHPDTVIIGGGGKQTKY